MKIPLPLLICAAVIILVGMILITHDVDTRPTDADHAAWDDLLAPRGQTLDRLKNAIDRNGFDGTIDAALLMQDVLITRMANDKAIPLGMNREPADLLMHVNASCGDRARALAKGMELLGIPARHVFIRGTDPDGARVRSHAGVEIDTPRGPLLMDTNTRWVALGAGGKPTGYRDWQKMTTQARTDFPTDPRLKTVKTHKGPHPLLLAPDLWIMPGLYSMHGQFYPPFTPYVPDIDAGSFIESLVTQ